ncbi:TetR/AcrR family transcriptional regulator [Pseudohalocynthiibacter sp. F2068]|uniref:TetR/AcrR family transcriptional regulator n=1 Tax=Pseudohalocynthiibacter sp. F2068 TaxID=2926418 RepID=UPI001FF2B699|nr:TetR/AcrR family transcriptional regulator [Pseudohalocynthiibacter sp. F2068]MCK0103235.1 TetR/AcrR family transcriptional regulator [Pseudohalocynthiibacter sp. F2068]
MARPREFDIDAAIDDAMDVFWIHGFEGTSLPDLLSGMGLTRGSLYKAFKDKKSLFMLVLERYEKKLVEDAVVLLTDSKIVNGWDRVTMLFDIILRAVKINDRRGCLLCSAAAGPASYDPEIAKVVKRGLEKMRAAFEVALDASLSHVTSSVDARRGLANVLKTQYVGLRILARSQMPVVALEQSVASVQYLVNETDLRSKRV